MSGVAAVKLRRGRLLHQTSHRNLQSSDLGLASAGPNKSAFSWRSGRPSVLAAPHEMPSSSCSPPRRQDSRPRTGRVVVAIHAPLDLRHLATPTAGWTEEREKLSACTEGIRRYTRASRGRVPARLALPERWALLSQFGFSLGHLPIKLGLLQLGVRTFSDAVGTRVILCVVLLAERAPLHLCHHSTP